jgi:hypothetical protein
LSPGGGSAGASTFRFSREAGCFLIILLGLIFSRGAFVWYESLHFDSDQAVVGLMAVHLIHGKGFTVFLYGQNYLATVEPYLAVPIFMLCGPSRWGLKLPLLVMGIVIAMMMYVAFRRDAGASPRWALLLLMPFVFPSVVMSDLLVQACGGNPEVFLWAMALWFLRRRPVCAGLVAGFAVQNRLLSLYVVCSLWAVLLLSKRWHPRDYLLFIVAAGAVYAAIDFLASFSLYHMEAYAPARISTTSEIMRLSGIVFTRLLPLLYGFVPTPLSEMAINCHMIANPGYAALLPVTAVLLLLLGILIRPQRIRVRHWELPCYLMCIGVLSLVGFIALKGDFLIDQFQARYLLLSLMLPVGAACLLAQTRRRRLVLVSLALWGGVNVVQHALMWTAVLREPPPDAYEELARVVRDMDPAAAAADYSTAYYLTFLLEEKPIVASTGLVRIPEYQDKFRYSEGLGRVLILDYGANCPNSVVVDDWVICPEKRRY